MHKATPNAMQDYTCTTLIVQTAKWVLLEGGESLALHVQQHITMNQHKQHAKQLVYKHDGHNDCPHCNKNKTSALTVLSHMNTIIFI